MKSIRSPSACVLALAAFAASNTYAATGDTATYLFNLPSTAVASQNPPYPLVATLTLTEVATGVEFLLTPNWADTTSGFSPQSFIERLDYVYVGGNPTFTDLSPTTAPITSFDVGNNANMDSGYKSDTSHIEINWGSKNDPNRFESPDTSKWLVSGVLTDFTVTQATHNSHPSPTFGILSVTGYSLDNLQPTPSNWVTGESTVPVIPEPEIYAVMVAGLAAMGFMARRRRKTT